MKVFWDILLTTIFTIAILIPLLMYVLIGVLWHLEWGDWE